MSIIIIIIIIIIYYVLVDKYVTNLYEGFYMELMVGLMKSRCLRSLSLSQMVNELQCNF